jgi:hypothetical protein
MGNMVIVDQSGKRYKVNAPPGTSKYEIEKNFARQSGKRGTVIEQAGAPTNTGGLSDPIDAYRNQTNEFGLLVNDQNNFPYSSADSVAQSASAPRLDPNLEAQIVQMGNNPPRAEDFEDPGFVRRTGDAIGGMTSGVYKVIGATAGLGTYIPGVRKLADPIAEAFDGLGEKIDESCFSDFKQPKKRELQADLQAAVQDLTPLPEDASFSDKVKHVADHVITSGGAAASFLKENPTQIGNFIAETIPYIFGGGALGKGVQGTAQVLDKGTKATSLFSKVSKAGPGTIGAIGEGLIAAGDVGAQTAIEARAAGDYEYDPKRLYGLLTAPVTAAIGTAGSRVSGVTDVDTLVAKAVGAGTETSTDLVKKGIASRVTRGAVTEGTEELLQGGSEQVFSNLASDKPAYENVGGTAVLGAATGATLGAGVNLRPTGANSQTEIKLTPEQIQSAKDEAALQQDMEAEAQQEQVVQAEALVVKNRSLREAAKEFTPKEQFVKARQAADSNQLKLDAANPETEIGQAIEANLDAKGLYDPKEVAKETAAFLKSYQKDRATEALDTYNAEYQAALEKYASAPQETQVEVEQANAEPAVEPKYTADTPIRSRKKAIEKAEELLGKDFADKPEFDAVASSINGDKFKVKTFDEALSGALNPQAVTEDANALTDEATQTNTETEVATTAEDIASQIVKPLPDDVKLSKNEQKVWDVISNSFKNNEEDSILNVNGSWNTVALAEKAGLNSRQAAQTATVRLKPKLAKAYGFTETEIKQKLADTKKKSTEPAPDINDGTNVLDLKEIGAQGGMETKASVNQGAREGMSAEDAKFMEDRSNEPDAFENKRQELANKERGRAQKKMVQLHGTKAIELWRDGVSTGGVQVNKLAKRDLMDWISSVEEFQEGQITQEELAQDLRDIENKYDQANDGPTLENANAATTEKTTKKIANDSGQSAGDTTSAESGSNTGQVGTENTGESTETNPLEGRDLEAEAKEFAVKKLGKNWDKQNPGLVQILKDKEYSGFQANVERVAKNADDAKLGVSASESNSTARAKFDKLTKNLTGETSNLRVHVFDTSSDAVAAIEEGSVPFMNVATVKEKNPYGYVVLDENGIPHAHFILDRITPGREMAVFMHEVGGHVGMDTIIDAGSREAISNQIVEWAELKDDSLESQIAGRTLARTTYAQALTGTFDNPTYVAETIAYFLEEATVAGIDPSANSTLGKFVKRLRDLMTAALDKLGFDTKTLSAQDIIDMAYGAAYIELVHSETQENIDNPITATSITPNEKLGISGEDNIAEKRSWAKENLQESGLQLLDDSSQVFKSGFGVLKPLSRIVRENSKTLPSMGKAYDAVLAYEKSVNEFMLNLEPIRKQAKELTQDRLNIVNDFIGKSTFYQKWGYDPKFVGKTVKVDTVLEAAFGRLTEDEQNLVKSIFKHGEDVRVEMAKIAKDLGISKDFMYNSKLDGPYAPLKRFGGFVAELKSQALLDAEKTLSVNPQDTKLKQAVEDLKSQKDNYVLKFMGSMGAAKKFARANEDAYASAVASEKAPTLNQGQRVDPQILTKVMAAIGADSKAGLDPATQKAVQDVVEKLYIDSLDENNARLSGVRRKNRAGFEENMIHSFFSHAHAQARLVAQMKHGKEVNQEIANTQAEAAKDRANLQKASNLFVKHYQMYVNPSDNVLTAISDRIASYNTVTSLTSNIGYHVTNAFQPLISIQKMTADFADYPAAVASQVKAYKIAKKIIKGSLTKQIITAASMGLAEPIGKKVGLDLGNEVQLDVEAAPKYLQPMLKNLQLRQLLDQGIEQDLNFTSRFDTGYASVDYGTQAFKNISDRLYQTARYVEAYNRVASAIAAYDMANKNRSKLTKMNMSASDYATAVVEDTQGNFSRLDSAMAFKALPKLTLQYRKYQVMMAWLWKDAFVQAFTINKFAKNKVTPEERAVGARMLAVSAAHTAMISGTVGVPFLGGIGWLVNMALKSDEEEEVEFDLERYIREKVLPEDEGLATLLSRGVPAFLGVDMSQKLKQSDIFKLFPYSEFEATEDGVKNYVLEAGLGPTANTLGNFGRAAKYFKKGDTIKGFEYLMPKNVRSSLESYRLGTEGFTLSNGNVVFDPRDIDVSELLLNAVGLPPSDIAKLKWTRGQQFELQRYFNDESTKLRNAYVKANKNRDQDKKAELRAEWRDLQKQKAKVRPFFNNAPGILKAQPVSNLVRVSRSRKKKERQDRRRLTGN